MGDVVKPHVLTYSGTFHQWLLRGVSARRTLPTICAHLFSVVQVSFQEASGKAGQQSGKSETAVRRESIITLVTAKRSTAASFPFSWCVASIGAACRRWQFRAGIADMGGKRDQPRFATLSQLGHAERFACASRMTTLSRSGTDFLSASSMCTTCWLELRRYRRTPTSRRNQPDR